MGRGRAFLAVCLAAFPALAQAQATFRLHDIRDRLNAINLELPFPSLDANVQVSMLALNQRLTFEKSIEKVTLKLDQASFAAFVLRQQKRRKFKDEIITGLSGSVFGDAKRTIRQERANLTKTPLLLLGAKDKENEVFVLLEEVLEVLDEEMKDLGLRPVP